MRLRARRLFFVGFALTLTSCGTAFSCGSEFGAPPERAFWCAPAGDVGKFFETPLPAADPAPPTVTCTETLGDRDCVAASS
jgi:hypothetical protein